jgi:hypothetical protein
MRTTLPLLLVLTLAGSACVGDGSSTTTSGPSTTAATVTTLPSTTAPATTAPATTAPATTGPASTAPPTTSPATSQPTTSAPTTTVAPPTTAACTFNGSTRTRLDGFPERMTAVVGVDIRTGAHPCYERIVIEFADSSAPIPGGMPGWVVRYADGPIYLGESDETVDLEGDATLLVSVAAWMPSMEGEGYDGPTRIFPNNVSHLLELRQVDNWEGQHTWAIGLDRTRPFNVFTLPNPMRLVIDVGV